MKKITLIFMALLVTCFAWQGTAQTVTGSNLTLTAIPDNDPAGVTNTVAIAGIPAVSNITDVELDMDIEHTWVGDVSITLTAPTGDAITVVNRPGRTGGVGAGDSSDYATGFPITFTDASVNDAEQMGDTILGGDSVCEDDGICDYFTNPDEVGGIASFADFATAINASGLDPNGNWSVLVQDEAAGDTGDFFIPELRVTYMVIPLSGVCATDNPQAVDDFTSVTSVVTLANPGVIGAMTNQNTFEEALVQLQHDRAADLVMTLTSPAGTVLELSSNNGGADGLDAQANVLFVDGQPNVTTWTGAPVDAAGYEAEGGSLMATFAGEPVAGDWTLTILDGGLGEEGDLFEFCLTINNNGVVGTPPTISCPADITITTDDDGAGDCTAAVSFADAAAIDAEDGPIPTTQMAG
ncbi:proprotein convertase P-domain-containing protein, partial [Patiriisocius hiemis]